MMRPGYRYERCEQCGKVYSVSIHARLYAGVYICPVCAGQNRREQEHGDQDRRESAGERV